MLQITPALEAAREEARATPLDQFDMSRPELFQKYVHWPFFDRLRAEDPVHYCADSEFGPFWSITKYDDIMEVDTSHKVFSSEPSIVIGDPPEDFIAPNFIAADEPVHSKWRKPVQPGAGPNRLAELEPLIRSRVGTILDELPRGETFNWVEKVSIELTTQMLATLFDFPFEERHLLPYWSDVVTAAPAIVGTAGGMSIEERRAILMECTQRFIQMWKERAASEPKFDFISLMAHHPDTADIIQDPMKLLGNLQLLIVGGNDTTRNSISASVLLMNQYPGELEKLKANTDLIPNMVKEVIRYQTPLAYMRRRALVDYELGGKTIRAGDKVLMWYVSGNRDEEKFENAYTFDITRKNANNHISFGFGIHRCMGNRVGEMQVRILWEEILKRFDRVELMGEPTRVHSSFVMGVSDLPVRVVE